MLLDLNGKPHRSVPETLDYRVLLLPANEVQIQNYACQLRNTLDEHIDHKGAHKVICTIHEAWVHVAIQLRPLAQKQALEVKVVVDPQPNKTVPSIHWGDIYGQEDVIEYWKPRNVFYWTSQSCFMDVNLIIASIINAPDIPSRLDI